MLSQQVWSASVLFCLLGAATAAAVHSTMPGGHWINLTSLSRPRQEHSTAVVNETTIAIVAGAFPALNGSGQTGIETTNSVELYDIPSDTWRAVASAPFAVNHPNVATVGGRVYLLGGLVDAPELGDLAFDWEASGESYVYDPAEDTWSELEAMPRGTERGSAIIGVHGDMIYLAGGMTTLRPGYQDAVSIVTAFNTTSGSWQRLPASAANIPMGRQHSAGGIVGDFFYVVGGRGFGIDSIQGTVVSLDLNDLEAGWMETQGQMPTPRGGLSAAVVNGSFFTFGGEGNPDEETRVFSNGEAWDIETQEWRVLEYMPVPRHGTVAVAVGGRVYIPGGGLRLGGAETSQHFDAYVVGGSE